jgi:hypothetical protein
MVADKLTPAVLAEAILFVVVFFPFRVMFGLWQWGQLMSMVMVILHSIIFCPLCLSAIHHTL